MGAGSRPGRGARLAGARICRGAAARSCASISKPACSRTTFAASADRSWNTTAICATSCCAKGYDVHYHEFPGGHDRLTWRGSLADGLLSLIGF